MKRDSQKAITSVQSDADGLFYFIAGDDWTAYNTMTEACDAKRAYDNIGN